MLRDLYGSHPYASQKASAGGNDRSGSPATICSRTYGRSIRPERMVLAVSGEVARDRVVRAAERLSSDGSRDGHAAEHPPRRRRRRPSCITLQPSRLRSSWDTSCPPDRTRFIRPCGCSARPRGGVGRPAIRSSATVAELAYSTGWSRRSVPGPPFSSPTWGRRRRSAASSRRRAC